MEDMAVVIMAGGSGTRFWPASTPERPKQFIKLFGNRTLLQTTYDRVRKILPPERILVLTNRDFPDLVHRQLPELPSHNIIAEPMRRDTAAAVALGALLVRRLFGDVVMAVLPSDHLIRPVGLFQATLESAARGAAESTALYTFGIRPTRPDTGYGYLEQGAKLTENGGVEHFDLLRFHEKPDLPQAREYLHAGTFFWNSGMFVWKVSSILSRLEEFLPEHIQKISRAVDAFRTPAWEKAIAVAFNPLRSISVDFGVMEKSSEVRMVASDFSWSDVGGWTALEPFLDKDPGGNAVRGRTVTYDSTGNIVFNDSDTDTVALLGVRDLVVVRAGTRILITPKNRSEDIKKLVSKLEGSGIMQSL